MGKLPTPFEWLMKLWNNFTEDHTPMSDADKDGYSTIPTLRGFDWRGRDCNDFNKDIHPGRAEWKSELFRGFDYNCNGIDGIDVKTGKTYEELYCKDSHQMGVGVIGDSAAAHFSFLERWFNVSQFTDSSFDDVPFGAMNEFDWP